MSDAELSILVSKLYEALAEHANDDPLFDRVRLELEWLESKLYAGTLQLPANYQSAIVEALKAGRFKEVAHADTLASHLSDRLQLLIVWNLNSNN